MLSLYHWRELPQVTFLLRQKFCRDKDVFIVTNMSQHNFVATKHVFSHDKGMLVATKLLSQQNIFVTIKCFVATKIILVAAPANDILNPLTAKHVCTLNAGK